MTVTPKISIVDGNLVVHGQTILTEVPDNVVLTAEVGVGLMDGAFIGATAPESRSHHVFSLGVFNGLRFMSLFRFKLWWMTQRMGSSGRDVPLETQFMVVEGKDGSTVGQDMDIREERPVYVVFLPLLEGQFRSVLQGNERNQLEMCIESGDCSVKTSQGLHSAYIHAGEDPFQTITDAVKAVEKHLQTFHHREKKKLPSIIDWFGWCTWDAFYTDVTAEGVKEGLKSLSEGGTPPRFLIIDDGWQQIGSEVQDPKANVQEGAQFASRLTGIKENQKFQANTRKENEESRESSGLQHVVLEAKEKHKVKYVYVWHALTGYWGGVKPAAAGMEHFDTSLAYPVQCPGILGNQPDIVLDSLSVYGLGLVHPQKVFNFYNELHSYLASAGVDGVKVDVQNIIETLGAGHGGRVSITRQYHQALEASIVRNFPDNGCIACMCHNTDGLYSAKQTAVVRASDDYYPRDPASHTIHICSVAYNTIFLGEFMQPDWDMFHSLHPAAEYHGAARSLGGCAIYVSDKPGNHNFELLKKLVLPDGSVLRARLPGRPTRDCLFVDPARDGKSLLKIWNLNKHTGVIGIFNCQGAGWCRVEKKNRIHDTTPLTISGSVRAQDVDFLSQVATTNWNGDTVFYSYRTGDLVRLAKGAAIAVSLKVLEFELYTVCPVMDVGQNISFAGIGLLNMFNSGGAIEGVSILFFPSRERKAEINMKVRGCGLFGAYSSEKPTRCLLDDKEIPFTYEAHSGLLKMEIPVPEQEMYHWNLKMEI